MHEIRGESSSTAIPNRVATISPDEALIGEIFARMIVHVIAAPLLVSANASLGHTHFNSLDVDPPETEIRGRQLLKVLGFGDNEKLVLIFVKQNGLALQFASPRLQNHPHIVETAVKQNGLALEFASEECRNNPEIVQIAVEQNKEAFQFASKEVQEHFGSVEALLDYRFASCLLI